jgi:signal transduction histidine kinase
LANHAETDVTPRGKITYFHFVVVALSLMLTLGAWKFSLAQVENRTDLRFAAERDSAIALIMDRMQKYEDALWAGVAAIRSHGGDISHADWNTFAHSLRIEEKYPGINGIGVIHYHTPQSLGPYLAEQRRQRPDYRVHPPHDQPIYMPITYIEPENINIAAIGLDVAHEINRRTAALASRDSGTAQITGPIVLVQDAASTPGFLFYVPFYRDETPGSFDDRQDQFRGAVYAPFVVHKLMEGLLAKELRNIRFSIEDGSETIYDEHSLDAPGADPDPMYTADVPISLYGREWVLHMRTDLSFRQANTYAQPTIILIAGLIVEVLIISVLILMSRANSRAVAYADKVTAELLAEKQKLTVVNSELSRKNDELEQFTYIASHDLKTPIRGISGLTEMIEEDLDDYFAQPKRNPDIRANLRKIHERVRHMDQLTRGILEFSQAGLQNEPPAALSLAETVTAMQSDFGLTADQICLCGDVTEVSVDISNFRRVLENLVGNAVKYHHDVPTLRINLSARRAGNHCEISVSDNGPGIDPKFHNRIFDVFQTLRTSNTKDSTGIGLAIVKKAVGIHGGTVRLTSSPGQGATFSFPWPLAPAFSEADHAA